MCPKSSDSAHNHLLVHILCFCFQEEQEYSAQQSASVNRAYSTLLKPYSRGLYLVCQLAVQVQQSLLYTPYMESAICNPCIGNVNIMNCWVNGIWPYCDSHAIVVQQALLHLFTLPFFHVSIPPCLYSFMSLFFYVSIPPWFYFSLFPSKNSTLFCHLSTQLKLNGLTIDETDNHDHDTDFLDKMWLLREAIEDATATGDTATLQQIKTSNSGQYPAVCMLLVWW